MVYRQDSLSGGKRMPVHISTIVGKVMRGRTLRCGHEKSSALCWEAVDGTGVKGDTDVRVLVSLIAVLIIQAVSYAVETTLDRRLVLCMQCL